MTPPGAAFGARLRRHREQRDISLRTVAGSTKIAYPLLQALERGDVSQWPQGIYRAGFIRAYAAAVGLPVDETALEFARAFGETAPDVEAAPTTPHAPASPLRLMLAPIEQRSFTSRRATIAAIDACFVVIAGLLVSWPLGVSPWAAVACCALAYYAGSTTLQGRTPAAACLGEHGGVGAAPREVVRTEQPDAPPAALVMTLATDAPREDERTLPERRTGTDRRRSATRHDPPRHGHAEPALPLTPSMTSVH